MNGQEQDLCSCRIIHNDRVSNARKNALPDSEHQRLTNLYKAMGDSTRLRILSALSHEEMCVCDLAVLLGITESAVSHQLRRLKDLRLVKYRRDGQIYYYSLQDDHVVELLESALDHMRE